MAGSFTLDISRWCNKAKGVQVAVVQKIAMETFRRVIFRSPVDTGRFRANWGCSVGSPWVSVDESATDKSGAGAVAKAQGVVSGWNGQGTISLCNNLSYNSALEFGHSKQAPQGMIRVTAAEIQAWAQNASNIMATIGSLKAQTGGS